MANIPRKIKDIIALSFKDLKSIDKVGINGTYQNIPFKLPVKPNCELNIDFSLNLDKSENINYKRFIIVSLSGTAILFLNNKYEQAIDAGHKLIIINDRDDMKTNEGKIDVRIKANPRGLFGHNQWSFDLDAIYYGYIDFDSYIFGLYLKNIYNVADKSLPAEKKQLDSAFLEFPFTPGIRQITCEEAVSQEKYGEYSDIADFYSYPVFSGKLNDLPESKFDLAILKDNVGKIVKDAGIDIKINGSIVFLGHCHIDVAWLWPYSETRRKVFKSFLNIVKLHKMGYDFVFAQSTALFYEWMEDTELFQDIRNMIKLGKWIPVGGMYVESDTNLISGESLARQLLYGQRYFLEKFGTKCEIGWLPDSFGFSFQLPQLLKQAGMKIFVTHKMKWNDTTYFPYDLFSWKGLDGTEVCVSLVNNTYNGSMEYKEIIDSWNKFNSKKNPMIYLYGYGDGGGGPNQEMIELMNRLKGDISHKLNVINKPAIEDLYNIFEGDIPVYNDELYLEYHRGVYTTNSHIKDKVSKLSEELIIYDFLDALDFIYNSRNNSGKLKEVWKALLKSEFHDVIPGSANHDAYLEAFEELNAAEMKLHKEDGKELFLVNYSGYDYTGTVDIHDKRIKVNIPGFSLQRINNDLYESISNITVKISENAYVINNGRFTVLLRKDGTFSIQINGRTAIKNGNLVKVINDIPERFDAWNIDYDELKEPVAVKGKEVMISVIQNSYSVTATITRKYMNESYVTNKLIIDNSQNINVKNSIYMETKEKLVKSYFEFEEPVKIVKSGIPFGAISREESKEKFEFPVLGWINCPKDSGIYFISRTIHGYSLINGILGISLCRYPAYPDPFTENIVENEYYIHVSETMENPDFLMSETLKKPVLMAMNVGNISLNNPIIEILPKTVAVESIKVAENQKGIVLRIFETAGKESYVDIKTMFNFELYESDLIETNMTKTDKIKIMPFQIKTIFLGIR